MMEWIDLIGRWLVIVLGVGTGLAGVIYALAYVWSWLVERLVDFWRLTDTVIEFARYRKRFEAWLPKHQDAVDREYEAFTRYFVEWHRRKDADIAEPKITLTLDPRELGILKLSLDNLYRLSTTQYRTYYSELHQKLDALEEDDK